MQYMNVTLMLGGWYLSICQTLCKHVKLWSNSETKCGSWHMTDGTVSWQSACQSWPRS